MRGKKIMGKDSNNMNKDFENLTIYNVSNKIIAL